MDVKLLPKTEDRRLRNLLAALMKLCETLDGGRYDVMRGAVSWQTYVFKKRRAVSILCDETTVLRSSDDRCAVTLEMMTKIDAGDNGEDLLQSMRDDAVQVLQSLEAVTDDDGEPLIMRLDRRTAAAIEVSEEVSRVKGVWVTVFVEY